MREDEGDVVRAVVPDLGDGFPELFRGVVLDVELVEDVEFIERELEYVGGVGDCLGVVEDEVVHGAKIDLDGGEFARLAEGDDRSLLAAVSQQIPRVAFAVALGRLLNILSLVRAVLELIGAVEVAVTSGVAIVD